MVESTKKYQFITEEQEIKRTHVWEESDYSSYYDYKMDTQCYVPADENAEEILKSMKLEV